MTASSKPAFLARLGRRFVLTLVVLALQIGFIIWLGQKQSPPPRLPAPGPALRLTRTTNSELFELMNPTLFALPNEHGFSGAGWLSAEAQEIQPFEWSDPEPRWLELNVTQLGAVFQGMVVNRLESLPGPAAPEPELLLPNLPERQVFPGRSSVEFSEELRQRRLLNTLDLPPWRSPELITNTVVQLMVDAEGLPFSFTLVGRSGHEAADQHALAQARRARFERLPDSASPLQALTWGLMTFNWHTLPPEPAKPSTPANP